MIRKALILPVIFFILLAGCIAPITPEKTPETGTIQFTSSPSGAQVYLDSQFRGTTPSTLTGIDPGKHTLEFQYPGYQSWSAVMVVSPGPNNVFIALIPGETGSPVSVATTNPPSSGSPVSVTLDLQKEYMIIGESMLISGTAAGCNNILLTISGPGVYSAGMSPIPPDVNSIGRWSYTWNPGTKLLSGTYAVVVTDPDKKVSERKEFSVLGGGEVTVTPSKYAAVRGDKLRFSGICTTGAPSVKLLLYGPENYAGGVELGTFPVRADNNWEFIYTLDNTIPTGTYTMYVYDVPKTSSDTTQFTIGYAT